MSIEARVQQADFSVTDELAAARERIAGRAGAVVSFVGLVRELDDSGEGLSLEHYPGMTESSMLDIVEQARGRWTLLDAVVIHRVGDLAPADQIVFVQVASPHRADAFAACEFIMDYLKTDAVFWKREGGRRWIQATGDDQRRRRRWEPPSDER